MNVSINFVIPDPTQLAIYFVIGFISAILIAAIGGIRSFPAIFLLTVLAAIGGWLMVSFVHLQVQAQYEMVVGNIRLIEAVVGALIFGLASALFLTRRKLLIK